MGTDKGATLGAWVATAWLFALVILDLLAPVTLIPAVLLGLGPLIACAALPPRRTALFGAAAVLLLVWSGVWNDVWDTAQQWVRFTDVVLTSAIAVVISAVRVQREQQLTRVRAISEAAQRAILPILPDAVDGVLVASRYQSASEDALVGGDLYDCSLEGPPRFVVGDVRGKGVAAIEQAARVIRAFRQSAPTHDLLSEVAGEMHLYLQPFLGEEDFVTAILADVATAHEVVLVSCGHPPALLVRPDGTADLLEAPAGLPLGIAADARELHVAWGPGDRLLLYTDGLGEARDAHGEFLPVLDVAPAVRSGTPEEALDALLAHLRSHVASGSLGDDLAVVLLENHPSARRTTTTTRDLPLHSAG